MFDQEQGCIDRAKKREKGQSFIEKEKFLIWGKVRWINANENHLKNVEKRNLKNNVQRNMEQE